MISIKGLIARSSCEEQGVGLVDPLWILSNLRYFMILISPRKDSEHSASWFYCVKDKILLGCVAAKTQLSLIILTEMCVFASCL